MLAITFACYTACVAFTRFTVSKPLPWLSIGDLRLSAFSTRWIIYLFPPTTQVLHRSFVSKATDMPSNLFDRRSVSCGLDLSVISVA